MGYHLSMIKYDVIIIGAGCSGLSLAYRLLNTNKKVCVIEKFSKNKEFRKHGLTGMSASTHLEI